MAILQIEMHSETLGCITPVTVAYPAEQRVEPVKRILYLLHGYSGSNTDWLYNSNILALSEKYGIAVVMPYCSNSFYLDDHILNCRYEEYMTQELPDFAGRLLRIASGLRMIGGLSMGGYGALHLGLKYPELFPNIIALSPALIMEDVSRLPEKTDRMMSSYEYYLHVFGIPEKLMQSEKNPGFQAQAFPEQARKPRVFLGCGTEDDFLLKPTRKMRATLAEAGFSLQYKECPGQHEWSVWNRLLEPGIRFAIGEKE